MKFSFIALFTIFFNIHAFAGNIHRYEVTITNLTKGQPLTPPVIISSNRSFDLYAFGKEASEGLKGLSKDGKTALLVNELSNNQNVFSTGVGTNLILPGKSDTIEIEASKRSVLSFATMLAKTNDAFTGKKRVSLRLKKGKSITFLTKAYDAGAETNNESKDYIPGLGSAGADTPNSEGFVHPHPGIYGVADLNPVTDAFSTTITKVTVKRVD